MKALRRWIYMRVPRYSMATLMNHRARSYEQGLATGRLEGLAAAAGHARAIINERSAVSASLARKLAG